MFITEMRKSKTKGNPLGGVGDLPGSNWPLHQHMSKIWQHKGQFDDAGPQHCFVAYRHPWKSTMAACWHNWGILPHAGVIVGGLGAWPELASWALSARECPLPEAESYASKKHGITHRAHSQVMLPLLQAWSSSDSYCQANQSKQIVVSMKQRWGKWCKPLGEKYWK